MLRSYALVIGTMCFSACSPSASSLGQASAQVQGLPASALPRTHAERTQYRETSSHADVVAFLDSLQSLGAPIRVGIMGRTGEGREIPYVLASRPLVATPAEARRLGRPVVYVQGNIHGGEVEGKEVVQALVRDLVFGRGANVLDSLVLIAVPIYNADGNDAWGEQQRNRGSQQGPQRIGLRPNAAGLDLNRDYMKAEAPETRATLELLERWDPDVFVDLHTTNGSHHGYALTYAPSLHPAAMFGGVFARDSILPVVRRRVRARHGFELFDYGNFSSRDTTQRTFATYDHRPRFGTNYTGLRGRIGILSEAYSHDPFERRVASTRAFVTELLSLVAERGADVIALSRRADRETTRWGMEPASAPPIPLRAELTRSPFIGDVLIEDVERLPGDSTRYEAGMPPGARRTGRIRTVRMPVVDRFDATLVQRPPYAYGIAAGDTGIVRRLRQHGVRVERLTAAWTAETERFAVDSLIVSPRPFQGHNEARLEGRWTTQRTLLPEGAYIVTAAQPLGVLAMYLLEPHSDDGLAAWNLLGASLRQGAPYPVVRIVQTVDAPRRLVP